MTETDATAPTRDERIAGVQNLLWQVAREFRPPLPGGLTTEDLVSEANVRLCRAADRYDPAQGAFTTFAHAVARNAICDALERERAKKRNGGRAAGSLQPLDAGGEPLPLPADPKAADPADVAAMRESLAPRRQGRLSVRRVAETLPTPGEVADQVVRLRAAMFDAISPEDVTDVMQAVVREAKAGDAKAAKLLIDLLAPARSGVTVQQQAVVIHQGDLT